MTQNTVSESTTLSCCMYMNMHIDTYKSLHYVPEPAVWPVSVIWMQDAFITPQPFSLFLFFFCLILMREGTCCTWQLVKYTNSEFLLMIPGQNCSYVHIDCVVQTFCSCDTMRYSYSPFVHHSMPRWPENNAAWTYGRTSWMVVLVPDSLSAWLKRKSRWKIPISARAGESFYRHLASSGRNPKCQAGSNTWGFVHYSIRRDVLFIMFAVSDLQSKSKQLI